jgi:hypothetical protein
MSNIKMRYGFVCVIDILGTKETWKNGNIKDIIEVRNKLINSHEYFISIINKQWHLDLSMQAISDTIIVSMHLNNDKKFAEHYLRYKSGDFKPKSECKKIILDTLNDLNIVDIKKAIDFRYMQKLVSVKIFESVLTSIFHDYLKNNLFIRGAISYEKFYKLGKSVIIGPAINRVSQEYDQSNWIGIHYDYLSTTLLEKEKISLNIYKIPFKGFSLKLGYLNWLEKTENIDLFLKVLNDAKAELEKNHTSSNDVSLAKNIEKYNNTIQYFNEIQSGKQTKTTDSKTSTQEITQQTIDVQENTLI